MNKYFNYALPFFAAFILFCVGAFGLEANWRLAAEGFGKLPGLESFGRLVWALALLPTGLQAYLYANYRRGTSDSTLLREQPIIVFLGILLTIIEINLVRVGIDAQSEIKQPLTLLLAEATFLALGAEFFLVKSLEVFSYAVNPFRRS